MDELIEKMFQKQVTTIGIKKLTVDAKIPVYATEGSAGFDLYTVGGDILIQPHSTVLVPTGLAFEIPVGFEVQIRARSGIALKTKLRVANGVGTIDSDYKGEVKIIIDNIGDEPHWVDSGTRIAQGVIGELVPNVLVEVEKLSESDRGEGGFNSTGLK